EDHMHPYEMIRLLDQRYRGRMVRVTNGTLYHTVARLEQAGLIAEVGTDRDGNRPERTTYALTEAGREALTGWVRERLSRTDRGPDFRAALAEAHNLDLAEVIELIGDRRAALAAERETSRTGLASARERGVPEQYLVELGRHDALLVAELAWTDDFLARVGRGDVPWGVDDRPSPHAAEHQHRRKAVRE
ncbi:MAG: PadR family transcriptional regulator, partial [Microbacterium sp.]